MDRRRATLGAAAVGVAAGAVALALVAAPAGAGQSPTLPKTTPDALVQSVLTARMPALSGTVEFDNNLGLPAVPGLPQIVNSGSQVRVWTDGQQHSRLAIPSFANEQTMVDDGTTVYSWDSRNRTVVEHTLNNAMKQASSSHAKAGTQDLNPANAARDLVSAVGRTSNISVDGTNMVANRPTYDLVLTPKAGEHTLLREVQIAVDAQTRIPLRLTVLAENTDTPALQIGFTSLNIGAQDPSLFHFSVPAGATVINGDKQDTASANMAQSTEPKLVGDGWDTVIVANLPTPSSPDSPDSSRGTSTGSMTNMAQRFGTAVHGSWGSGWLISTDVGNAVLTSDGRVAVGFVPQQLLYQALGSSK